MHILQLDLAELSRCTLRLDKCPPCQERAARIAAALLDGERDEKARKYDLARSEVKIDGGTRAHYVLQRDAALEDVERLREVLRANIADAEETGMGANKACRLIAERSRAALER